MSDVLTLRRAFRRPRARAQQLQAAVRGRDFPAVLLSLSLTLPRTPTLATRSKKRKRREAAKSAPPVPAGGLSLALLQAAEGEQEEQEAESAREAKAAKKEAARRAKLQKPVRITFGDEEEGDAVPGAPTTLPIDERTSVVVQSRKSSGSGGAHSAAVDFLKSHLYGQRVERGKAKGGRSSRGKRRRRN